MNADPEGSGEAAPAAVSTVELRIPPRAEHLRLARFVAADAASRAGFDLDAVDDLRLAVSEMCSLLVGSGAPIHLSVTSAAGGVVVEGWGTPGPELDGDTGDLAQILAKAVVDEYEFVVDGTRARFRMAKSRHA